MITLIVLIGSFILLVIISRIGIFFKEKSYRELGAYSMAIFLVFFGISHFYKQDELILMLPDFMPFPEGIIFITGIIEIILAFGLLFPTSRQLSGLLIAFYYIAVLQANISKVINTIKISRTLSNDTMSWIRIFFQPIFIIWALCCSKGKSY